MTEINLYNCLDECLKSENLYICVGIHRLMGTKTISIMDDVYELLVKSKHKNESFSDIIRRTLKARSDFSDVIGGWSDISDSEFAKIENAVQSVRKSKRAYLK